MAVDSLRETFHTNRIQPNDLNERLTAQSYRPDIIKAIKQIHNWGNWDKLENLCIQPIAQGRTPIYAKTGRVCLKTRNIVNLIVSKEEVDRVPEEYAKTVKRFWIQDSDLLMTRSGSGSIGRVSIYFGHDEPLTNDELFRISISKFHDSAFIGAFLICWWGERIIEQGISGSTGQLKLVQDHVAGLPVILPDSKVQKYIGDKVRQAERLRERSKKLEQKGRSLFESVILWSQELENRTIYRRIGTDFLEQRLDLNFNSPSRLRLIEHFIANNIKLDNLDKLVEISAMIGWKGLTTEHYTNKGPWLLRGVEFSNGVIDFDSLISIEQYKYDEQPQIHLAEGDIAFTKDGTIGKAIVIPILTNDLAAGSTVARLRPYSKHSVNIYYLELVLNHPALQIQVFSFATGIAQPHITQEWIARLQIPRCGELEETIGQYVYKSHQAQVFSSYLTTAAKLLVEALIEGILTEEEMKLAREALDQGDRTRDRAILARLTRKGCDRPDEPPLFPDLDALYQALSDPEEMLK